MKIKLLLKHDGSTRVCSLPFPEAAYAEAEGACPCCADVPFKVAGKSPHNAADDRAYEATAECLRCRNTLGVLRVETSTLFGVTEDEAVLNGRCRVY